jgi:hypothetical protein
MNYNRLPFFEVLGFQADFKVSDYLFNVSLPAEIEGVETKVTLTPKQSQFFGTRVVRYRRFDLSEIPRITVQRLHAKTHCQLARNLQLYPLFKYRLFDTRYPDQIAIRYLHLQPFDIQDELLPNINTEGQHFELSANTTSDFFIGQLKIALV